MKKKTIGFYISHDVASGSDITPYNKIDKPLVKFTDLEMLPYDVDYKCCVK